MKVFSAFLQKRFGAGTGVDSGIDIFTDDDLDMRGLKVYWVYNNNGAVEAPVPLYQPVDRAMTDWALKIQRDIGMKQGEVQRLSDDRHM